MFVPTPQRQTTRVESSRAYRAIGVVAVLLATASCERTGVPERISERRPLPDYWQPGKRHASSGERFAMVAKPAAQPANDQSPFQWQLPEGWQIAPPNSMRVINLKAANGEVECYLSLLPGRAGGIKANVNRWREQMGQQPLSDAEVQALPKHPLLGGSAVKLSLTGSFRGMGQSDAKKDHGLEGLILDLGDYTLFVKMTGPKAEVSAQQTAFGTFVRSLRVE